MLFRTRTTCRAATCTTHCDGVVLKRGLLSIVIFACSLSVAGHEGFAQQAAPQQQPPLQQQAPLHQQALQESLVPVRPGLPGERPFWNRAAQRFMYAPAFDFEKVEGAVSYRFTAAASDGKSYVFRADKPWASLAPIWLVLPVGTVDLIVEGLAGDSTAVGATAKRTFYKAAVYGGSYREPLMGYTESARRGLQGIFQKSYLRHWLKTGKPDPAYWRYSYPAKIVGAVIAGAAMYASLSPRPEGADEVLEIGRKAADYLLSISEPRGSPLAFFPPTYHAMEERGHMNVDRHMLIYPAEAGKAYLDLYDATGDETYFEAARRIADSYRRLQLDSGTWHLFMNARTGEPVAPNLCIPMDIITFLSRLEEQYGVTEYASTLQRAVEWVMENPAETYNWQAQFEDVKPRAPYERMSREGACELAQYLLQRAGRHPAYVEKARVLIRFAEDQFVIWERPMPLKGSSSPGTWSANWITPSVQEQYGYWQPIARSVGIMIATFQKAYEVTGERPYLAKATSLANTLTYVQTFHEDGHYPTYLTPVHRGQLWINNSVYPARAMIRLGNMLKKAGN